MRTSLICVSFVMISLVACSSGRIEPNAECKKEYISVKQQPGNPQSNGIPTFDVNILNECAGGSGCSISGIHLSCGSFASAKLVDPKIFRRLSINDCLVNDGKALAVGDILSFSYANSFSYPLSVSMLTCS